ncbi:hypothetical protein [Streptomyces sp. NPDC002845]
MSSDGSGCDGGWFRAARSCAAAAVHGTATTADDASTELDDASPLRVGRRCERRIGLGEPVRPLPLVPLGELGEVP